MALLEASNMTVHGHTSVTGIRVDSSGNKVFGCYVGGYFSGTYVQADNAQFTAVTTAIASSLRSNATITLLSACFAQMGSENGTQIGVKTVAVSSANITCELTGADLTTEHAGAALSTMTEPIYIYVTYKSST
jgi:hypothetical protein